MAGISAAAAHQTGIWRRRRALNPCLQQELRSLLWAKEEAVVTKTLDSRVAHSLGQELIAYGGGPFPFSPFEVKPKHE